MRSPSERNDRQNPPAEAVGKFLFLEWPFQAAADMGGFNFSLQSDVDIGRLSAGNVAAISMIAALRPDQGWVSSPSASICLKDKLLEEFAKRSAPNRGGLEPDNFDSLDAKLGEPARLSHRVQ